MAIGKKRKGAKLPMKKRVQKRIRKKSKGSRPPTKEDVEMTREERRWQKIAQRIKLCSRVTRRERF